MNDYFTICKKNSDDIVDVYDCCLKTCVDGEPKSSPIYSKVNTVCTATCGKVFPENMRGLVDECIIKYKCWDNYVVPRCVKEKHKEIYDCCMEKCNRRTEKDCHGLCKQYKIVDITN